MTSKTNRKKLNFYRKLSKKNVRIQKKFIQDDPSSQFAKDIIAMTHHIKHNKLPSKDLKKLKRFRKCVDCLLSSKTTKNKKARVLKGLKGGFLGALIPIISGLAAPLISKLLG